jgi:hypothetical protein
MRKVKGIGQWAGKDVPGMYQGGGETPKNRLRKADISEKPKKSSGKGDISMKGKGPKPVKPKPTATFNKKAVQKALKKVGKKRGLNLIPLVGQALLAKQVYKEIKTGGAGIKKNIKNVKDFVKTGDWGHILEGKSSKKSKPVKKTSKKKDTKPNYIKKRDKDYTPQSKRK